MEQTAQNAAELAVEKFAKWLIAGAQSAGHSQRRIARVLGVSQATVSRWGDKRVPMPLWAALVLMSMQPPTLDAGHYLAELVRELRPAVGAARRAAGAVTIDDASPRVRAMIERANRRPRL